jgi:hypothetical protein
MGQHPHHGGTLLKHRHLQQAFTCHTHDINMS